MSQSVSITYDGAVAKLKLGNAELKNALGKEFFADFARIIEELDNSGKVRALVLYSDGPHFSSGIDLSFFADQSLIDISTVASRESFRRLVLAMQDCCSVLNNVRFPVLAACQGASLGAALDLISACDLRYATADAYFVIQEINIGLMADLGGLQRLPLSLPDAIVRELAFTGEKLTAERAERLGFVNKVFANHDEMIEAVVAVAQTIAARSPLAVAGCKQSLNYNHGRTVEDALANAAYMQAAIFDPAAIMASVKAMKTKATAIYDNLPPDHKLA